VGSTVVRARGLAKTFGEGHARVHVLDGADLEVERGELVAVVGRSGSGKSTLLHLLGGLDRPDAGEIELDGQRIDRLDERRLTDVRRRKIGFVFQAFHLLPELTGAENVLLPARLAHDGVEAAPRARALLGRLGLADVAARLPTELSGGEQQRLAIARALINDPLLILADEPTGNLHSSQGKEIMELFKRLNNEGTTIIQVTHNEAWAAYGHRIINLRDGWITSN
jgi:putative ABC transport system ATP-binding protein